MKWIKPTTVSSRLLAPTQRSCPGYLVKSQECAARAHKLLDTTWGSHKTALRIGGSLLTLRVAAPGLFLHPRRVLDRSCLKITACHCVIPRLCHYEELGGIFDYAGGRRRHGRGRRLARQAARADLPRSAQDHAHR